MYDVKTLCQRSNISQQTFYRLTKENEEFGELVKQGRQKRGNSFHYPETVLQWLLAYYSIPSEPTEEKPAPKEEKPVEASQSPSEPSETVDREKPLLDKIDALEAEIRALQAKLEEKEQERKALFIQNGQLLYLLSQEKQEKQALLPAPAVKKPLIERIKGMFSKEKERPAE